VQFVEKTGTLFVIVYEIDKRELTVKKIVDIILNVVPGNVSSNVSGDVFFEKK